MSILRPFGGRCLPVLLIGASITTLGYGQNRQPRRSSTNAVEGPVYTDPLEVDQDYAFQGEFRGWQRDPVYAEVREAGLQVVALGNGQFHAVAYRGGLPGDGWYGGDRRLFAGERQENVVALSGDMDRLDVLTDSAILYSNADERIGEFQRVHRISPTMGARPPATAIRLFTETGSTAELVDAKVTEDGLLLAGTETTRSYTDFRLHGEFRLPYKPQARGQARGNSGFYLQSRYEVQVLDSFGLEGIENECGALYKTRRPDFNMCFPPLIWQTYDIDLTSPRFDSQGNKVSNMRISVWHNGVMIHNNAEIPDKTGAGKPEAPTPLPIKIQDHRNPVVYRNLWLVEKRTPSGSRELVAAQPQSRTD